MGRKSRKNIPRKLLDSRGTGSDSGSVLIRDIRVKKSSFALVSSPKAQAPSDWVSALKDVSFEVKRGGLGIMGGMGPGQLPLAVAGKE